MCAFDDSLTEIDWLNSLCIQKKSCVKEENTLPVTLASQRYFATPINHINETCVTPRCNGYDKPSYSYAYLIKLAIESSMNKRMKLSEIYSWITEKFPYYKYVPVDNNKGWKNAIRHNLSLNKIFKRCAKDSTHLGKGSYWMIDPKYNEDVQYPPVKKMKFSFNPAESIKSNIIERVQVSNDNIVEYKPNVGKNIILEVPVINQLFSSSITEQSDKFIPVIVSTPNISAANIESFSIESPLFFPHFQNDNIIKPPFVSSQNFERGKKYSFETVPQHYSCEISYLEVDQDIITNKSAKDDFMIRTPVLSQINSIPEDIRELNMESKDIFDENTHEKSLMPNNYSISTNQEATEIAFDTWGLYDSFISLQQPALESESQVSSTKDYFELKSSLINYRPKNNSIISNQLNASTSSTELSSNTLRSSSDVYKKSDSFGSGSDFENFKQDVSEETWKYDVEEEIKDIFQWDAII